MFKLFKKSSQEFTNGKGFEYLEKDNYYFDSACQTLRPQETIDAINSYYTRFNACGHRVQYKWGKKVDEHIENARSLVLKRCGKSSKDYTVAFTNNATMGINLVLGQLRKTDYKYLITTQNEHSSVMIPSITIANRNNWNRKVLDREEDYSIIDHDILPNSVYLFNSTNNYDGMSYPTEKLRDFANRLHKEKSIVLLDACQTFGHNHQLLHNVDFDACFVSFHKCYGPSLGAIIIKKELARNLDYFILGGSTIGNNDKDTFELITDEDELFAPLEPGLQDYAGITGLVTSLEWLEKWRSKDGKTAEEYEKYLAELLWEGVKDIPNFEWINKGHSSIISGFSKKDDGHKIASFLSQKNIMVRSGYHCVYNYLTHVKNYPPLFRISLGINNTKDEIEYLISVLKFISSTQ